MFPASGFVDQVLALNGAEFANGYLHCLLTFSGTSENLSHSITEHLRALSRQSDESEVARAWPRDQSHSFHSRES